MRKKLGMLAVAGVMMAAMVAVSADKPAAAAKADYGRHYMICVYETPEEFALRTDPVRGVAYWKPWTEYMESLTTAGVLRFGLPLQLESAAKTVTVAGGHAKAADGVFAGTKPQLTGFFVIEVDSMEKAVEWAAKVPNAATHAVDVRHGFGMAPPK